MLYLVIIKMIKTIIFDWGGVLAPADTEIAAKQLSDKFGCDYSKLKEKIKKYEKENSESSNDSMFLNKIKSEFGIPEEEIMKALTEIHAWEGFEIAKSLIGKFKLCILSDQMQFKADYIKKNNDLSFFDIVLFSSEIGAQKPSEKAFQIMLEKLEEAPEECLFIDDREVNVKTAQGLGINVIHCEDIDLLKEQLNEVLKNNS